MGSGRPANWPYCYSYGPKAVCSVGSDCEVGSDVNGFGWTGSKHSYVSSFLILYLLCNDPRQLNCFSFGFSAATRIAVSQFSLVQFCFSTYFPLLSSLCATLHFKCSIVVYQRRTPHHHHHCPPTHTINHSVKLCHCGRTHK